MCGCVAVHGSLPIGNTLSVVEECPLPDRKALPLEGPIFISGSDNERQRDWVGCAAGRIKRQPADAPVVRRNRDLVERDLATVLRWDDRPAGRRGEPELSAAVDNSTPVCGLRAH